MPSLLDLHYCSCVLCDLLPSALWYCWIRKEITWSQLLKEKIEGQLANPDSSKHVKLACVCVDLVHGQRNWGGLGETLCPSLLGPGITGGTMKMIFLVTTLCFCIRQSFEIFLLCSVQVIEFQLPWFLSKPTKLLIPDILFLFTYCDWCVLQWLIVCDMLNIDNMMV